MDAARYRPGRFLHPVRFAGLACLVLLCEVLSPAGRAELLYFKNGGAVQTPVTIDGDHIVIDLAGNHYDFLREDFRKVVIGFIPEHDWDTRRLQVQSLAFPARYQSAWWAITNGLGPEAAAEIRALHALQPGHGPTARMASALNALQQPAADPDLDPFRRTLGVSTTLARGPHVILLHQLSEPEAQQRLALLERVFASYFLTFAAEGVSLRIPQKRLVFAWFNEQQDYLAFLHAQGADAFASTRGYYHPTWNAVLAYDAISSEEQLHGKESVRARREELAEFRATVDRIPPRARLRVTLTGQSPRTLSRSDALALAGRLERELRREELLLDLECRMINDGTAAHELIHLLAAASGLLPRPGAFPVWLQEGLAMQFEVIRGGRWAGVGRASDPRLPDWRRITPVPKLEPMVRDTGYGRGYRRDLYAQAWSLVYYLRDQHPAQFLTYLDLLRSPDAALEDMTSGERSMAAFRRAFGPDLETLERSWHEHMAAVQTPLEKNAPAAAPPSLPSPNAPASVQSAARRKQ